MTARQKLHLAFHLTTAAVFLVAAAFAAWRASSDPELVAPGKVCLTVGLFALVSSAFYRAERLSRWSMGLGVSVWAVLFALAAGELFFRLIGYDFRRAAPRLERVAPYYRRPTVPTGSVFFRRRGPQVWRGKPLRSVLLAMGYDPGPARGEPTITLRYDADGFRNEAGLKDWEIAVAGDSFVELGVLPYEKLFTSRLAQLTGRRARNLGVSHTGPWSYLHFLKAYGRSPSLRVVVAVFYEGNDLSDLTREEAALERWRGAGKRPRRDWKGRKQTSLVAALLDWSLKLPSPFHRRVRLLPDALWPGPRGEEPVTLNDMPPQPAIVTEKRKGWLREWLRAFGAWASDNRLIPWVVYMPAKGRVLWGKARLTPRGRERWDDWHAADLAGWMAVACAQAGVRFLDLTPALCKASQPGRPLLYSAMGDTHLNARGAELVARELARALREGENKPTLRSSAGKAGQ